MFVNFFKVAFRVFIRNRTHTLVNIFGLAIGLMFSIIIFLYAHKELSYDHFHQNARRISRVAVDGLISGNKLDIAITATPLAQTMVKEIPEVEDAVRVARYGAWLLRNDSIGFNEDNLIFSDPGFFKIFTFPLIQGSPETALSKPFSVVLSESSARRYFGSENPLGRRLRVENDSTFYTVTGIMEDVPENSHLQFDMVGAISTYDKMLANDRWVIHYLYTYFLAKEGSSPEKINAGLERIVTEYVIPDYQKLLNQENREAFIASNYYRFITQPLVDIHFDSAYSGELETAGKFFYIYLFIVLALIIMILSCMNFISLVTAQSMKRALEVGIRKISGSERYTLINQFLIESSLLAFFAMALALLFSELVLPWFSKFIGLHLSLAQLLNSAGILLIVILMVIIGVFSGLYPAWYLSSYNPKTVLRNRFDDHPDKGRFRKVLTIFQLFLAVGAVTMTLIILFQYRFLVDKDRGYDTENIVVIRRPDALTSKLENFKSQLSQHPGIVAVSNSTDAMGSGFPRFPYYPEGGSIARSYSSSTLLVSYGFDTTYGLEMASGRFFDRNSKNDTNACVINETAARDMNIVDPVGKTLYQLSDRPGKTMELTIIGVVKDFYYETLENPIRPLVMLFLPKNLEGYLAVRLDKDNQDSTIHFIKRTWEAYTDAYPFVYYYLDQDRRDYYRPVLTTARIFIMLSIVTILMASLSIFALVSFTYNRKQREIGILKAMGASNLSIILHRTVDIFTLVLSASVAAWIGTYILAKYWLRDYANHVNINVMYFIISTLVITLITVAAVYYHTRLSVRANPGSVLKYE